MYYFSTATIIRERASVLRYTYIAPLVYCSLFGELNNMIISFFNRGFFHTKAKVKLHLKTYGSYLILDACRRRVLRPGFCTRRNIFLYQQDRNLGGWQSGLSCILVNVSSELILLLYFIYKKKICFFIKVLFFNFI
jgi:hypothetical protein